MKVVVHLSIANLRLPLTVTVVNEIMINGESIHNASNLPSMWVFYYHRRYYTRDHQTKVSQKHPAGWEFHCTSRMFRTGKYWVLHLPGIEPGTLGVAGKHLKIIRTNIAI